ncbi:MAG TPA: hypothetical protein PKN86_07555, partial [Candidatus Obscuribacter sp.]|nr:hypothetical protein [Candidatus Obscuribacter sp.]
DCGSGDSDCGSDMDGSAIKETVFSPSTILGDLANSARGAASRAEPLPICFLGILSVFLVKLLNHEQLLEPYEYPNLPPLVNQGFS